MFEGNYNGDLKLTVSMTKKMFNDLFNTESVRGGSTQLRVWVDGMWERFDQKSL